jgi:tRNA pseudouridine synthase 10
VEASLSTVSEPQVAHCYICNGLFSQLPKINRKVLNALKRIPFATFQIGITLDPQMLEREDELRAKYKIRGKPNIKRHLSSLIAQAVSADLMVRRSSKNPDIEVKVDLVKDEVQITRQPVLLYGRYTKVRRGIDQKAYTCEDCRGYGCIKCQNTGFKNGHSVEKALAKILRRVFHKGQFKFTWFGSEDAESLVLGKGRPFLVEVKNPLYRRLELHRLERARQDGVILRKIRLMRERIFTVPPHKILWRVAGDLTEGRKDLVFNRLRGLTTPTSVVFVDKDKSFSRNIWRFRLSSTRGHRAWFSLTTDSGFNIRAFFHGKAGRISAKPSAQEVLNQTVKLVTFDVMDVDLQDSLLPLANG